MAKQITKDVFIKYQNEYLDEMFGLMPLEIPARKYFDELASETFDVLNAPDITDAQYMFIPHIFDIAMNATVIIFRLQKRHSIAPELTNKWIAWENDMYPALKARNPNLEIHDMLIEISESYDHSSWPWGYENEILEWVKTGSFQPIPQRFIHDFTSSQTGLDEQFFNRLCEVYKAAGGWLTKDNEHNLLEFFKDEK
jgi:hypothetical protein